MKKLHLFLCMLLGFGSANLIAQGPPVTVDIAHIAPIMNAPASPYLCEGKMSTASPSYYQAPVGLPNLEWALTMPDSLADDSSGAAVLAFIQQTDIDPSAYGLMPGDEFCIMPVAYDLPQIQAMVQQILTGSAGFLGACCGLIELGIGYDVCGILNAAGYTSGNDIQSLSDVLFILSVFDPAAGSVSLEGFRAGVDNISQSLLDQGILGSNCGRGQAPIDYGVATASDSAFVSIGTPHCYTVNWADMYEPNDVFANSSAYPMTGINAEATLCDATDSDWYSFNTGMYGSAKVVLTCLADDYDLELYSGSQVLMASSTLSGQNRETIINNSLMNNTDYFVKVSGYNGAFDGDVGYCLHITVGNYMINSEDGEGEETEVEAVEPGMRIFPNPVNGDVVNVSITADQETEAIVTVFDMLGRAVQQQRATTNIGVTTIQLNANELGSGIYNVVVESANGRFNQKLEVLR